MKQNPSPADGIDRGRRALLRGQLHAPPATKRPPWAKVDLFTELCSRCGDCIAACPEGLLTCGDGGFPEPDFSSAECTFCGACVQACPKPIFNDLNASPWTHKPLVAAACLSGKNVFCASCRDACPENAIRLTPRIGSTSLPEVSDPLCTGCGACVAACPTNAISLAG